MNYSSLVCDCLFIALKTIKDIKGGEEVISKGKGFGDLKNDTEIKADKIIGEKIAERVRQEQGVGYLTIEGLGETVLNDDGVWVTVDPLDGSLNYALRGITIGLPYSACITVLRKKEKAVFGDVIAAGVIDLRSGDTWVAWKEGNKYFTEVNEKKLFTEQRTCLDLGQMIVVGEMYYPENRELLCRVFSGKKGWLRNPGSAAYEMALVASGGVAAFICDCQKQHELGAAFALVKGAGGVVVDFDLNDLAKENFFFNAQSSVVLAGNMKIAEEIINLMKGE